MLVYSDRGLLSPPVWQGTEDDGVHIIAIGGTSFRRYLELARLLENRVAALRDNDGNYQQIAMNAMLTCFVPAPGYLLTTTTAAPHLKSACIRIMPTCVMRFPRNPPDTHGSGLHAGCP